MIDSLGRLNQEIIGCRKCPRLVAHREQVAAHPPKRYAGEHYWAKPLPGFGDPRASIYVLGLAPAANGGNRTGRIFTGDRSGDWLYATLYDHGFASRPDSLSADDGMRLYGVYIGAAVRCAPPDNKPTWQEYENCRPYAVAELAMLPAIRVFIALGSIAYGTLKKILRDRAGKAFRFPQFGHGVKFKLPGGETMICSYHPSQQNTFTGKLTRQMFWDVFAQAKAVL